METTERIIESIIDEQNAGQRLDLWLSRRFTYLSRRQWQDTIREGRILLNGDKTRCSRVLQVGEKITFLASREEPNVDMKYEIIYEDDYFYAVNKGGNLPCHPAGAFFRHTLWYDMNQRFGRVFIINRLDRETSGIMLVGKTSEIATRMSELFQLDNAIQKKYYALVYGRFDQVIHADGFLLDEPTGVVRKKRRFVMTADYDGNGGESAETLLKPVTPGDDYSLVEALPQTGRLHQIRATLCSLGFPLVGDKLYGLDESFYLRFADGTITAADRAVLVLPRQALHAYSLEFRHPVTALPMKLEAPMPADLFVTR